MLWGSFGAYLISQFIYICVEWTDPKNHIENKRGEMEDHELEVSDQEDQAIGKIIF